MLITDNITINGKEYTRTRSDNVAHPIVRCGKDRYYEAIDPVDVERAYFEEIPTEPETETEEEADG